MRSLNSLISSVLTDSVYLFNVSISMCISQPSLVKILTLETNAFGKWEF
jgi:hypothetical protein